MSAGRPEITGKAAEAASDAIGPLVVSPSSAMIMLDCGRTRLYEMLAAGELESFLDGSQRKITVASIRARIQRKLDAARAENAA
jgi:hypothetical protein